MQPHCIWHHSILDILPLLHACKKSMAPYLRVCFKLLAKLSLPKRSSIAPLKSIVHATTPTGQQPYIYIYITARTYKIHGPTSVSSFRQNHHSPRHSLKTLLLATWKWNLNLIYWQDNLEKACPDTQASIYGEAFRTLITILLSIGIYDVI